MECTINDCKNNVMTDFVPISGMLGCVGPDLFSDPGRPMMMKMNSVTIVSFVNQIKTLASKVL